jgi:hypothetical protein
VTGPQDLASGLLEFEHEVDGPFDGGPHLLGEAAVCGDEPLVPYTGGDVGDHVGVELVLLDAVLHVVLVPGAVGSLDVHQPLIGPFGLSDATTDGQGHGRFHVVPRVGVTARHPRDHA